MGHDSPEMFANWQDPDDPQSWKAVLEPKQKNAAFGLIRADKIMGVAHVVIRDNVAEFGGIYIDPSCRRMGLADCLHDIRRRYLTDIGFDGVVETQVLETNQPSLNAAKRNGFFTVGTKTDSGEGWSATYIQLHLRRDMY